MLFFSVKTHWFNYFKKYISTLNGLIIFKVITTFHDEYF